MKKLLLFFLPLMVLGIPPAQSADLKEIVFEAIERQIIAEYYREHSDGKPGAKKAKGLPPGIAKNLERGKALPPGIAKRQLPADLQARLPAAPAGHERVIIDGAYCLLILRRA